MSALDEQRDKIMTQEAGRASNKDHFGLLILDCGSRCVIRDQKSKVGGQKSEA
jgi:D-serine deaminase-like pyridoxal phosphate-dependent protein